MTEWAGGRILRHRNHIIFTSAAFVALGLTLSTTAMAQEASTPLSAKQTQTYAPDYFAKFQPQTAADMVSRIPGFSVQGGEGGARGFGQASLNLLINGQRPSSKSSGANQILSRIPAGNVVRIEILDGASTDIPGLSGQVANIVTRAVKLTGSWEYAARFEKGTEPQLLDGNISLSGERGNLSFVAGIRSDQFTFTEDGIERYFNGDLDLIEDRTEDLRFMLEAPSASLNLTWKPKEAHEANLNLSAQLSNQSVSNLETFEAIAEGGNDGQSLTTNGEDEYNYEIGADYSFPAFDGSLKLIGLYRFEESDFNQLFVNFPDGETPTRINFDQVDDEVESILRAEYAFKPAPKHDIQWSVEGAFNSLESHSLFSQTGLTEPIPDSVKVEEKRAETNVTHGWAVSPKFNLQSSIGVEYSQLDVVSRNDPARDFIRPKGFISASYTENEAYTWRARIEREVGQLNFGTFVSRVDLGADTAASGNPEIVPSQSWKGEVELERKSETGLSGTLKIFGEIIEDPIERIRFDNGTPNDFTDDTEGPGNVGKAYRYGVSSNATWLLDGFGFHGGRLTLRGEVGASKFDDPIIGRNRQISNNLEYVYDVTLRQDIPKTDYAWFVNVENDEFSPNVLLNQFFDGKRDRPELQFGVEHKDFLGMRLTMRLDNALNWTIDRDRPIFTPDRGGALFQLQQVERQRGQRFSIILSDTF